MGPPAPWTPHVYQDPRFPAIQENGFQILDTKTVNPMLTIMFCGVNRGNRNHLWNISVRGAPSCMIDRLYAKVDMGATNDRFLLVPDFLNDSLGSEFTAFLDHVEEYLKISRSCFGKWLWCGHLGITCACEQGCSAQPTSQSPALKCVWSFLCSCRETNASSYYVELSLFHNWKMWFEFWIYWSIL